MYLGAGGGGFPTLQDALPKIIADPNIPQYLKDLLKTISGKEASKAVPIMIQAYQDPCLPAGWRSVLYGLAQGSNRYAGLTLPPADAIGSCALQVPVQPPPPMAPVPVPVPSAPAPVVSTTPPQIVTTNTQYVPSSTPTSSPMVSPTTTPSVVTASPSDDYTWLIVAGIAFFVLIKKRKEH
jgi:hypothetical protein